MTREEAIKILKNTLACESDFAEAKQMAIKALEQEPCDDCMWFRQGVNCMWFQQEGSDEQ